MTTEKLKTQVAELLGVSESEKNLAFFQFKDKIANSIKVGEAIKISQIGIFQLKEQFVSSDSGKTLTSAKKKQTLIFSPIEKNEDESLFLNLELDDEDFDGAEFDEKVFNIGIEKPILPIAENAKQKDDGQLSLDEKITDVISKSEKIENFDLWDDYLDKQAANILPDENDSLTDIESYLQSEETGPSEDDFTEIDEDELFAEFESDELSDTKEPTIVEENIAELNDEKVIDLTDKTIEPANEILEDIPIESDEIISSVEDIEEVNDIDELKEEIEHKADESIFYETEETNIKESIPEQEEEKIHESENKKIKDETKAVILTEESDESAYKKMEKKMPFKKKNIVPQRRYSLTIYALIAAFFIVGAIGIYYLFFNNPTWLYDQNEIEIQLSEKHQREFEEAKRKARLEAEKQRNKLKDSNNIAVNQKVNKEDTNKKEKILKDETKNIKTESNKNVAVKENSEPQKVTTKTKVTEEKNAIAKVNKTIKTNHVKKVTTKKSRFTEAAANIYYDGSTYTLQVSSWPNKKLAEKEVQRLAQKGYDAFIMKAYIPKYKKNWYRVRIGDLQSKAEAKRIQQNIK